jgi:hypothetical protein
MVQQFALVSGYHSAEPLARVPFRISSSETVADEMIEVYKPLIPADSRSIGR